MVNERARENELETEDNYENERELKRFIDYIPFLFVLMIFFFIAQNIKVNKIKNNKNKMITRFKGR